MGSEMCIRDSNKGISADPGSVLDGDIGFDQGHGVLSKIMAAGAEVGPLGNSDMFSNGDFPQIVNNRFEPDRTPRTDLKIPRNENAAAWSEMDTLAYFGSEEPEKKSTPPPERAGTPSEEGGAESPEGASGEFLSGPLACFSVRFNVHLRCYGMRLQFVVQFPPKQIHFSPNSRPVVP